jgi:hypothetical protein
VSTLTRKAGATLPPDEGSTVGDAPSTAAAPNVADGGLRRLAALLATLAVLEAAALLVLGARGDERFPLGLNLVSIGLFGTIVTFALVGALIVRRRPRTRVAWIMIGIGTSLGTGLAIAIYGTFGVTLAGVIDAPFALEAMVIGGLFFAPVFVLGTTTLMLVYPTDTLLGPRWRSVVAVAAAASIVWNIAALFRHGPVNHPSALPNPLALSSDLVPAFDAMTALANLLSLIAIVLAAASLVLRYRRGDAIVRAQLRWFGVVAALLVFAVVMTALTTPAVDSGAAQETALSVLFFGLTVTVIACLPIAIGIAITRYRLYDIDLIINRALVYGSLTAILAGVFTAGVGLAQRLFVLTTGASSDAAIVLATLVIATLYAPLRKRLEAVIDRRFKYETRRFGSYGDKVKSVLSVIDPVRSADNLARTTVAELDAVGAAVLDGSGAVVASAGTWPLAADAQPTSIALAETGRLRTITVGPGRRGRPHSPDDLAALEEVGRLTAEAVRRD